MSNNAIEVMMMVLPAKGERLLSHHPKQPKITSDSGGNKKAASKFVMSQLMLKGSLVLFDIHASVRSICRVSALALHEYPWLDDHRP